MPPINGQIRVLHLEDNADDAFLVRQHLATSELHCDIVRVDSRPEFETRLTKQNWDAILVDHNVPGYDGAEALRSARQRRPGIPVLMLSGSLNEEEAVNFLQLGATDYVLKQRLQRLVPALRRALSEAGVERQRREAELALQRSEERFRLVFQTVPVGIGFGPIDGPIVDVNPQMCEFFGYTRAEMVGRRAADLPLWAEPAERAAALDRLHRDKKLRAMEARFRHKSGEVRTGLISMELLPVDEAPMQLVMILDLTERKALEAELHRAQRVESIGRLASGIAHDMNNILAPIMMAAPLLRMKIAPEDVEKTLATIEASAQRGADLVRQLLMFGRGVEGERCVVALRRIVLELAKIVEETFPKNIRVAIEVPPDLWPVRGDPSQLHQVLLNLCVNARDAMPHGGTLRVVARNVTVTPDTPRRPTDVRPGPFVQLVVSDTGGGIPPEIADRIFEPFFTTKEIGRGTGLGLSTVLGIVKSHDGFVTLQSELNQGTSFEVHLPATPGVEAGAADEARERPPRGNGELILVVDDEEHIRHVLRDTLTHHNYSVITASDGAEAAVLYAQNRSSIRLVLTDIDMPFMDGAGLIRVLRGINPGVRIVVSTGVAGDGAMETRLAELNALRVSAIVTKPYAGDEILRVVHEALDAR